MKVWLHNDIASISLSDIFFTTLTAIVIAALLKVFVLGAFEIPSSSMERTLLPGDFIMVSKLAFHIGSVERGDIIVFDAPPSTRTNAQQDALIKRVVGLPGDTVRLNTNVVYINGRAIPNPPLSASTDLAVPDLLPTQGNLERTFVVPSSHYFVLGDNRTDSYDSRYWGFLHESTIVGAPLFVYWSYGTTTTDTTKHVRFERIFQSIR